jgi:hypothetical protein
MQFDDRVSNEDLRQYWKATACLIKGVPSFVIEIIRAEEQGKLRVHYRDLTTMVPKRELISPNEISHVNNRLGFMNSNGLCAYISRTPVRKYMMGLSDGNIRVERPGRMDYRRDLHDFSVQSREFADMINGKYPTIKQSLDIIKDFGGAVAFDRQFAIDEERNIYYKAQIVGKAGRGTIDRRGLVFKPEFEYLKSVIGAYDNDEIARVVRG